MNAGSSWNKRWCSKISQVTENIQLFLLLLVVSSCVISLVVSALHCNALKDSNGYFYYTRETARLPQYVKQSQSIYTTLRQIKIKAYFLLKKIRAINKPAVLKKCFMSGPFAFQSSAPKTKKKPHTHTQNNTIVLLTL